MLLGWVSSKDEGLAASEHLTLSGFAFAAFKSESNLFGLLGLLLQDGLGLTTETLLFGSIPSVALRPLVVLAFLVLNNLLFGVFLALLAVGVLLFGSVNLSSHTTRISVNAFSTELRSVWESRLSAGKGAC